MSDRSSSGSKNLDDEMLRCADLLHCCQAQNEEPNRHTWTSHWVKDAGVSAAACTLLQVRRWYLLADNFLFDPLKANRETVTAKNMLWPTLEDTNETDISATSVNAILSENLSAQQIEALRHFDSLLDVVDCDSDKPVTASQASNLVKLLNKNKGSVQKFLRRSYIDFTTCLTKALIRQGDHEKKVPESIFEEVMIGLLKCLLDCVGDEKEEIRCNRNIDGEAVNKGVLSVALEGGKEITVAISSKPDLFVFERAPDNPLAPMTLIAVIEAKGLLNEAILNSDDEDEHEPVITNSTKNFKKITYETSICQNDLHGSTSEMAKCQNKLHKTTKYQSELAEIDEQEVETDLEKLIENTPHGLKRIVELPDRALEALQKFLPQLMGHMFCCLNSTGIQWFSSRNAMKFGIGLVGFDVYFVTMLEKSSETNAGCDDVKYTDIFITKPFKLLSKEDRRTIIKTLVASFYLQSSVYI